MTVEGFLTVPSEDGEKCDLYRVDDTTEETLEKIDLTELTNDTDMDYYSMPTYFDELGMTLAMDVRTNVNDTNLTQFISLDDGKTWKTEKAYIEQKRQEEEQNDASIARYNEMAENLDESVYLTDYTNIKRKAYVVTKENNMGNGVMVYVDVTTGLIIGGAAFGD